MPTAPHPTLISARLAGLIYFAIIGLGMFGELFVRGPLLVAGDATATANNILASQQLWRIAIATDLTMHVLDLPLVVFCYLLLKRVNHPLALLATAFNLIQTCALATNKLTLVAALSLIQSAALQPTPLELHKLAFVAIDLHAVGFGIGLIFFGITCLIRGWLIFQSGFVPRALGVLFAAAGVGYIVNSLALLTMPALAGMLYPVILLPALVAEVAFSVWLVSTDPARLSQRVAIT